MLKAAIRWGIPLTSLFVVGPPAGWLTYSLRAPDGSGGTTLLLSESPVRGLIAGLGALALAAVMGFLGARMVSLRLGLFSAGLVLTWAAWGTGTVDQIIRRTQSASTMWTLSLEGAILGVLAIGLASLLAKVARPSGEKARPHDDEDGPPVLLGFTVAIVVAGIAAWLVAQETLKGQTYAAAVAAAVFGSFFGRLGSHRTPAVLFFVALAAFAAASPAAAVLLHGGDMAIVKATYSGHLLPLARPLPLDWIAGAFVGIPIGLSWAASMTESRVSAATT
jgi:hypothetical protein